ncbi:MAG TPA: RidA family protein [Dongiaceae bacterium]|jgi:enamine deaminase RidA (YjgF/YER057c/UK114 family)|nr:RidA family protein [Dongiaceae bacterium]
MIVRNPTKGIYPATGDYVHAMEVQDPTRFLYVAGTMGLDERGIAGKTLGEQLDLIWSNIRVILASADMSVDNIVRLTSYLRDPAYAEENAKARVKVLNGRVIPTIGIVAQTLSSDWLVEIEVIAAA